MGKAYILTFGQFRIAAPCLPLNNVEKQRQKHDSSYVIGLQHCIEEEGGFLNKIFKIITVFSQ